MPYGDLAIALPVQGRKTGFSQRILLDFATDFECWPVEGPTTAPPTRSAFEKPRGIRNS